MKKLYLFFLFISLTAESQIVKLSPAAEISIITCGPGTTELFTAYGHSAFRVRDFGNGIDKVYNYGTFNFNTPNFYSKFVRGKLLYQLGVNDIQNFLYSYKKENRWVKGQVLDLQHEEIQQLYAYLENNAKPENRSYNYDFFFDNCSTRLYDVLEEVLGDKLVFENNFDEKNYSHRDLIQIYLGDHPWGDFGIDLALGSDIDKKATAKEYLFLPEFVLKAFTTIKIIEDGKEKPIIKRIENILPEKESNYSNGFVSPMLVFSILALLVMYFTFIDYRKQRRNKILDFIIFAITGLLGLLLLFLWFGTDHSATVNNTNIFWAFAPNIILAFLLIKENHKRWFVHYMFGLLILLDIGLLLWLFKVQIYSIAVVPIFIALYARYIYLWYYFRKLLQSQIHDSNNFQNT